MSNPFTTKDALVDVIKQVVLGEKTLTDAEKKKREEIAQAIERDNPGMDMGKKMAIATAQAKKVAEEVEELDEARATHASVVAHADKKLLPLGYKKTTGKNDDGHGSADEFTTYHHEKTGRFERIRQGYHPHETRITSGHTNKSGKRIETSHGEFLHRDAKNEISQAHDDHKSYVKKHGIKEEVETLDELSQMKLANYVAKAATSLHNNAKEAGQYDDKENANKAFKRYLGIKSASVRLRGRGELPGKESAIGAYPKMKYKTEEVEEAYNPAKDTFNPQTHTAVTKDGVDKVVHKDKLASHKEQGWKVRHSLKAFHANRAKKVAEEIDQDEDLEMFLEEYTTMFNEAEDTQQLMLLRAMAQDPSELMKMKRALNAGDKAMTNPVLRGEILKMLDQMMKLTTTDKSLLQRTRAGFQKAKSMPEEVELDEQRVIDMKGKTCTKCSKGKYGKDHPDDDDHYDDLSCKSCGHKTERYTTLLTLAQKKKKTNEEVESLDELSKGTLGSYIKKANSGERGSTRSAFEAGKTYSKAGSKYNRTVIARANKRMNGINKATDKLLAKEEVEQIDELKKDTMGSYIKKATSDVANKAVRYSADAAKVSAIVHHQRTDADYDTLRAGERGMAKRSKGIDLAVKKLTKEDVEQIDEADLPIYHGSRVAKKGLLGTKYGTAMPINNKGHHAVKWDNGKDSIEHGSKLKALKSTEKGYWDNRGGPPKHIKIKEDVEQIDEAKKTTHEDPLITVHKDGRLHAHAHLSTINDIHGTDVKHTAIHAGGAKVKTKYGDNLEYKLSRHHAKGVQESVDKDAPFEGGREVKSSKSASDRVKKIAKGMKKQYTKDKK